MFTISSRPDALASLWNLQKVFGHPIDFIADFPCYGIGGEQRKHEREERGVGQKNTSIFLSHGTPTMYYYLDYIDTSI